MEVSSSSDKAKLFIKNFSRNSNLDDSGIPLLVFPSRSNLKLHNIPSQEYPVNAEDSWSCTFPTH